MNYRCMTCGVAFETEKEYNLWMSCPNGHTHVHPDAKEREALKKVKIIACTAKKPRDWYQNRIGEAFEVIKQDGSILIVLDKERKGYALVLKEDVETQP